MKGGWSQTEKLRRLHIARKKWLAKQQVDTCPSTASSQTERMQSIAAEESRSKRPSTRTAVRLFGTEDDWTFGQINEDDDE